MGQEAEAPVMVQEPTGAPVCPTCGAPVEPGQEFCGNCGAQIGAAAGMPNAAIAQFNNGIEKKKKKGKLLPILLAVGLVVAGIIGYVAYATIQAQKVENYIATAEVFREEILNSGAKMESIGNEIQKAWRSYVYDTRYNGRYYYSINSAVSAAQSYMSSEITKVKSNHSYIISLYNQLSEVPGKDSYLIDIRTAVRAAYNDYMDMYDCVMDPSGSYSSWTSEFSKVDSALADSIGDLSDLL